MKIAHTLTLPFAIGLVALAAANSHATEGVSPGAVDRLAQVNNACPTFSWGEDDDAAAYDLVAYVLPEDAAQQAELTADREVLFTRVAGSATSWTPSANQCFAPGERYVWFVRAVTEMIGDQVIETGEWSAPRYFEVPAGPTADELAQALEVLRRWDAANGESATSSAGMRSGGPRPTLQRLGSGDVAADSGTGLGLSHRRGEGAGEGEGEGHRKSVPTASAAIRGEHPGMSGESYGIIGTAMSPEGAGVAAAHLDGGPDLVLDGSVDGEADTRIWEWGMDRSSATDETFSLSNSGAGRLHLDVNGDISGDTIDIEEIKINGSTVVDDTGEWMGTGSTVPCPGCVGSADIADGAVDSADLASASVTSTKIAVGAVGASAIHSNAVTTTALADAAVTSDKLAPGAVGSAVLGPDSVDSSHIADGAVATADLADSSVDYTKIALNNIRTGHLQNGAVRTDKIFDGAVTTAKILDGTVGTADLADGSITSSKIGMPAVYTPNLADWAVTTDKIDPGAVTTTRLADDAVTGAKITDGTVSSSDIHDGTITAADVSPTGGVYASKSAVYQVKQTETASSAFCYTATAACDDENDLPLSWYCMADISGIDQMRLVSVVPGYWSSTTGAAEISCSYCNDSLDAKSFEANILCISVSGP